MNRFVKTALYAPVLAVGIASCNPPTPTSTPEPVSHTYAQAPMGDELRELKYRAGDIVTTASFHSEVFAGDRLEDKVSAVYRSCHPDASLDAVRQATREVAASNDIRDPNKILPGTIIDYDTITTPCIDSLKREMGLSR